MKTKKIKILSVVLSMLLVFCVAGLFIINRPNDAVYAAEVVITDWSQLEGALVGETLVVPESVKLKIDENTEIDAESGLIYFPDGNAKSLEPKLLSMPGKYTLQYQATHEGKTIRGEKSFIVSESNYYLSNTSLSSAEFVKAEDLTMGGANVTQTYEGNTRPVLLNATDGIKVTLAQGDYFRFNQPVNLFDAANSDDGFVQVSLSYPMMDESILPGALVLDSGGRFGERLGSYYTMKLIDCYDESNFVEFFFWSHQYARADGKYDRYVNVGAGASEQKIGAIKASDDASASISINGTNYKPAIVDRYVKGTIASTGITAFNNTYVLTGTGSVWNQFSYNPTTHEVRYESSKGNILINDLDNTQIYPDNPFKGFTTGEVYVQYEFQNSWTEEPMELYIKSILGLNQDELKPAKVSDTLAPKVDIDVEYTDLDAKSINASYNKEFELPKANVYDVNGENEYELAVYYDYYTDNPKLVYLKDGKFTPTKRGVVYTAVYMVKDGFGNLNVDANGKCLDVVNIIPVSAESFSYTENRIDSLNGADVNYLPKLEVTSINKAPTVSVNVLAPNGKVVDITDSFDGDNYSFIPECIGEYTIKYLLKDNVNQSEYSYKVNSVDNNSVVFVDQIAIPSIFIKDAVYDLEPYFAYVATANGLEKRQADLLVSADGGEFKKISNQRKYKVEGNSALTFKAEYNGKQSAEQTAIITDVNFNKQASVNDGKRVYENYFVGYDSFVKESSYIEYGFDGTSDVDLKFASPLLLNGFSLEFEIPEASATSISAVSVTLKEIGGDNGYVIIYAPTATGTQYTVKSLDGNTTYFSKESKDTTFAGEHFMVISDYILEVKAGVVNLPKLDANNIEFSINVASPTDAFALRIKNICGTVFRNGLKEKSAQLVYDFPIGSATVGKEYNLPKFNINSIWSPVSLANFKYSFIDDDGNALVDINGKKVENISGDADAITVIPKSVKTYYFEFSYDGLSLADNKNFSLAVVDNTAPVVVFNDGANSNTVVKVNVKTMHTFKAFTVKDDVTATENVIIRVCVMDEYGTMLGWNVEKEFGFAKVGNYKVIVFAQDEAKNTSTTYYQVQVVEPTVEK